MTIDSRLNHLCAENGNNIIQVKKVGGWKRERQEEENGGVGEKDALTGILLHLLSELMYQSLLLLLSGSLKIGCKPDLDRVKMKLLRCSFEDC